MKIRGLPWFLRGSGLFLCPGSSGSTKNKFHGGCYVVEFNIGAGDAKAGSREVVYVKWISEDRTDPQANRHPDAWAPWSNGERHGAHRPWSFLVDHVSVASRRH